MIETILYAPEELPEAVDCPSCQDAGWWLHGDWQTWYEPCEIHDPTLKENQ